MHQKLIAIAVLILSACNLSTKEKVKEKEESSAALFSDDVNFLRKYTNILVLEDSTGNGRIAVSPALQGRVMTSSASGDKGESYGWINKALFESGDTSKHINAYGGEERLWLGPEGGQFSIFFEKGKEFTLENWFTPRLIDLEPFDLVSSTKNMARFTKTADIQNYSGTKFKIKIDRQINVLNPKMAYQALEIPEAADLHVVAFRTTNSLQNIGIAPWNKNTGVLSIWLLGMLNPSPYTTIVVPFNPGADDSLGPIVNDAYFGKVPPERLKKEDAVLYFSGDGQYRSKIGLSPVRARDVLGSYDSKTHTLTIIKYNKPETTDYVNSKWEIQSQPFKGDVINSYNDGPPSPGAKPMGPFYELESSSPAVELKISESLTHIQTTFHFQGDEKAIDQLSLKILGVSTDQIKNAFPLEGKQEK
jgi:hypothetical protein